MSKRFIEGTPSIGKSTANAAMITLGIDLAKTIFQRHGVDAVGKIILMDV